MPAFIYEVHPDKLVIAVGPGNSSLSETTTSVTLISNQTSVNESLETSMAINSTSVAEVDTTILTVEEPKEVPVMYIILEIVLAIFLISILILYMVYVFIPSSTKRRSPDTWSFQLTCWILEDSLLLFQF